MTEPVDSVREAHVYEPENTPLDTGFSTIRPAEQFWKSHPKAVLHRISTPTWRDRGEKNLQLLMPAQTLDNTTPLQFGGTPQGQMETYAFETRAHARIKYVGVASVKGKLPEAYLLVFRHSIREMDFHGDHKLLETGIGDYLIGRMQICRQILTSRKNVAVVIPVAEAGHGAGEFESDQAFIEQCLTDIASQAFPTLSGSLPLLLTCNSDGILKLNEFLKNCSGLVRRLKAVYDLDGSLVMKAKGITLTNAGTAKVFRYNQGLTPAGASSGSGSNPVHIPLPFSRWTSHGNYTPGWVTELGDPKTSNARKEQLRLQVRNWLHHFIPTCMLQHGLEHTPGL